MVQAEELHELPDAMRTLGVTHNKLLSEPGSDEGRPDSHLNTQTNRFIEARSSL